MLISMGYVPTIPEPPAGNWALIEALAILGPLVLAAVLYLLWTGARGHGSEPTTRHS